MQHNNLDLMIKLSFLNLFRRKTRTFLAVLGIAIGVAAILCLVSVVDGVYAEFNNVISEFQGIFVMEEGAADQPFSQIDESYADKIRAFPEVKSVIREIWIIPDKIDNEPVSIQGFSATSVYGLDISESDRSGGAGWTAELKKGTKLKPSDNGQILIGEKFADDYGKFVGSKVKINDKNFRVKGIFAGNSELIESVIAMNLDDARELSDIPAGKVSSFTVALNDPSDDKRVKELIEFRFGEDLQAFTTSDFSEQFGSILGNFRLLVFFIAAISAIVAGVGIANTILMSIFERYKEIGALKAVGWTKENIIKMIMYESLAVGIIGGIAGLILGFIADVLLNAVFGLGYAITPALILQAFGFAVLIGIIAGIYPSLRAASLDPVEAISG
jgi:putative ABC transport system permease protein